MESRSQHGVLVVIGCGPGIGTHVATLFGSRGFHKIIIMSRNLERLKDDAMIVRTVVPQATVETVCIDLASIENVQAALEGLKPLLIDTPPECVLLHAARSGNSRLLDWTVKDLQQDLQQSVISLYAVIRWAIPQLLQLCHSDDYKPTLLVTCATLSDEMLSDSFAIGVCQAAQCNVMHSCFRVYGPDRIHCALVMLHGRDQNGNLLCNARKVADKTWELYDQEKGKGELTMNVDGDETDQINHI